MKDFNFGQPDGGVIQLAYTVADIHKAVADYTGLLGIGPWFLIGPFTPPNAQWRGRPCAMNVTLGFGFSGHLQIELLQQHNTVESALNSRPLGFHHWGIGTRDFEGEVARRQARGFEVVFTDQAPDGARFAYLDTTDVLPGLLEIIEMTPGQEAAFTMMQHAALEWDGKEPLRLIPAPPPELGR